MSTSMTSAPRACPSRTAPYTNPRCFWTRFKIVCTRIPFSVSSARMDGWHRHLLRVGNGMRRLERRQPRTTNPSTSCLQVVPARVPIARLCTHRFCRRARFHRLVEQRASNLRDRALSRWWRPRRGRRRAVARASIAGRTRSSERCRRGCIDLLIEPHDKLHPPGGAGDGGGGVGSRQGDRGRRRALGKVQTN